MPREFRPALALGAVLILTPFTLAEPEEVTRPKMGFLRFNEDWSVLRDVEPTDPWDSLKFIPLSEDGETWVSFGGHARARLESWNNFAFKQDEDDTFLLWRIATHADLHFGDNLRVFIEGKSTGSTERDLPGGRRTLDVDSLDLEQAFLDVTMPFGDDGSLTLRPGRQTLLFGKQRLVSPLPWGNTLRRWDGVSAILETGGWNVTGFATQFAPTLKYEFNKGESDIGFYGVYGTTKHEGVGIDAYFLALDKDLTVTFNGTSGTEERYTLGGRLFGQFGDSPFDYDLEGAYQFGDVGEGDVNAYFFATQIGYSLPDHEWSPRFHVGFDYASGDDDPGGDVETFNHLFPLGHAYLGYMDFIGRQNIVSVSPGVTVKPIPKATLGVTGHMFWRAETNDAVYNAGGGVLRAGGLSGEREIGSEIDLTFKYKFDQHLTGLLGYSHFFAGDFIEDSGEDEDVDFFYAQIQYTF